jgi:hypothetical protein
MQNSVERVMVRNIFGDVDTGGRTLKILKKEMFLK